MDSVTIAEVAKDAASYFQRVKRGEDSIVTIRDDRPDWVQELVYAAHGDFGPDDWRYATIERCLDAIAESGADDTDTFRYHGDDHACIDGCVDIYTRARLEWLSSNLNRAAYCDDAVSEGLAADDADITNRIGAGQYMEASEIMSSVLGSCESRAEELTELA